jgi:hypothetical protein
MQNIIFFLTLAFTQPITSTMQQEVAILPKELETPKFVQIKRSRGKGRGNTPWFAKYF